MSSLALPWQSLFDKRSFFSEFWISLLLVKHHNFLGVNLTFFDHLRFNLLTLVTSWSVLAVLKGSGKIKKSKIADPRWPPFECMTLFWRHMTKSVDVVDFKKRFRTYYLSLSFVVIASIFSELRRECNPGASSPPGPRTPIKAQSE